MPSWRNGAAVEAWRGQLAAAAPDLPTDFLLGWIDEESAGDYTNVTTSAGFPEIGLFQPSLENALDSGTSSSEFYAQTTDPAVSISVGIRYVRKCIADAEALLDQYHLSWSGPDFGNLVKMMHALPHEVTGDGMGYPGAFAAYAADHGGSGPPTWSDARAYGGSAYQGEYDNAEYAGQYWTGGEPSHGLGGILLLAIAVAVIVGVV